MSFTNPSQVVYLDKPTIFLCVKHDIAGLIYDPIQGPICPYRDLKECDKDVWVEFTCEPVAFHDAVEQANGR